MTDFSDLCITRLVASAHSTESPFDRMIVLGWFDGPTEGIVICQEHNIPYMFHTLAIDSGKYDFDAWDHGREIQIIGLAELGPELFAKIVEVLSQTQSPRWPIWLIGPNKNSEVPEINGLAAETVDSLLDGIKHLNIVVAIRVGHALDEVLVARKIGPGMALPNDNDGWFSFLGYSEGSPGVRDQQ